MHALSVSLVILGLFISSNVHSHRQTVLDNDASQTDNAADPMRFTLRKSYKSMLSSSQQTEDDNDEQHQSSQPTLFYTEEYRLSETRLEGSADGTNQGYSMRPLHPEDKFFTHQRLHKRANVDASIPDYTDFNTIYSFAKMSSDAYQASDEGSAWLPIQHFNESDVDPDLDWQPHGVHGHVFVSEDDSYIIVAFKGTSFEIWFHDDTSVKDKEMDCRMFSCCCGKIGVTWTPYCNCYTSQETNQTESGYSCSQDCLSRVAQERDTYYWASLKILEEVQKDYPHSTIWLTGHSLGGSLAQLVSLTYSFPAITFSSPPTRLYSQRLGLIESKDVDTSHLPIWDFGNELDPIFAGQCHGLTSSCYYAGYAMESECRFGHKCVYHVRETPDSKKKVEDSLDDEDLFQYGRTTAEKLPNYLHDHPNTDIHRFKAARKRLDWSEAEYGALLKYDIRWHRIKALLKWFENEDEPEANCRTVDNDSKNNVSICYTECNQWNFI